MSFSAIVANFKSFQINDLVDVLIVSVLIYELLSLIRRTRSGQVAKGILLLLFVYMIAGYFNLRTISYLMQSVFQVAILALVVVFQPEIRKALERIGQTDNWLSKIMRIRKVEPGLRGKWRGAIIAICDACERMSEEKTGALIVLERQTNLNEIISTGTEVNGVVTPELLETIFYEGTTLHDGAVLIRNGKLRAAGCVLPLSNNLDLGKDMGTRHRACLGIAENSDALAIVVSEETGIISLAKNGVLIRHFDRQNLYGRLTEELIPKEEEADASVKQGWREQIKAWLAPDKPVPVEQEGETE